jgi:hypothetical protein
MMSILFGRATRIAVVTLCVLVIAFSNQARGERPPLDLKIEQVTFGTKHHFFGYIGQCQTIPWNGGNRYIVGLEIENIDRMPEPQDAAVVILVDTERNNEIIRVDKTFAWNPQQGTMFYWNPRALGAQFYFNDRDVETGKVFAVLFDVEKNKRVREFRYDDTPIGNSGAAPNGEAFLGLNYGRLARLRLVTGYPGSLDWSKADHAPANDGIFSVDPNNGTKRLLVSYRQLAKRLEDHHAEFANADLFINHTLWNRRCDRIYFFVRAGWSGTGATRIDMPCSMHADGTDLILHDTHIGGHPEWAEGSLLIGRKGKNQVLYDVDKRQITGKFGTPEVFPDPEGDISLSPDGKLFVNGYTKAGKNYYVVYRRSDGAFARSRGMDKGSYGGDIRIDPAPCWNRTGDAFLVPGIAANNTRQMFVIRVIAAPKTPSAATIE